jgi:general secretion pathway protein B
MSYILDALKKADKERKRGTVPNLSTDQDPPIQKPKKRSLLFYILIVALLINAGVFFFWLNPWKTKKTTIIAKTPFVVKSDIHEKASSTGSSDIQSQSETESIHPKKTAPSAIHSAKKDAQHELQSTIPTQKPAETKEQKQTAPILTTKEEDEEAPDGSSNLLQPQEHAAPPTTALSPPSAEPTTSDKQVQSPLPLPEPFRLYDLKSLPASVKEGLPDINISVFVYSDDPSSRVVKINGHTVREGQELTDGLKVEKIVPEGVIFKYEDYRFRVRIR